MNFDNVLPGLVVIIYIIVEVLKKTILKTNKSRKHIPLISCIAGVISSIVIFCIWPEILDCDNILDAISMGGLSGFAATGCNQLYKKYSTYRGGDIENVEADDIIDSSTSDGEGY